MYKNFKGTKNPKQKQNPEEDSCRSSCCHPELSKASLSCNCFSLQFFRFLEGSRAASIVLRSGLWGGLSTPCFYYTSSDKTKLLPVRCFARGGSKSTKNVQIQILPSVRRVAAYQINGSAVVVIATPVCEGWCELEVRVKFLHCVRTFTELLQHPACFCAFL